MKNYLGFVTLRADSGSSNVDNTIDISHLNLKSADDYFVILTNSGSSIFHSNGLRGDGMYIKSKTKDEFVITTVPSMDTSINTSYQIIYNPS